MSDESVKIDPFLAFFINELSPGNLEEEVNSTLHSYYDEYAGPSTGRNGKSTTARSMDEPNNCDHPNQEECCERCIDHETMNEWARPGRTRNRPRRADLPPGAGNEKKQATKPARVAGSLRVQGRDTVQEEDHGEVRERDSCRVQARRPRLRSHGPPRRGAQGTPGNLENASRGGPSGRSRSRKRRQG